MRLFRWYFRRNAVQTTRRNRRKFRRAVVEDHVLGEPRNLVIQFYEVDFLRHIFPKFCPNSFFSPGICDFSQHTAIHHSSCNYICLTSICKAYLNTLERLFTVLLRYFSNDNYYGRRHDIFGARMNFHDLTLQLAAPSLKVIYSRLDIIDGVHRM